jgi:diguanylate cyclase
MRFCLLVLGAVVATVAFGATVALTGDSWVGSAVSDFGQLAAATAGAVGCARAARRCPPEWRRSWLWLAVATGGWAAGQAVWTYYELVAGREVPFPSLADLGFLVFPVAAARGMVLWLGAQDSAYAKGRHLLDGLLVAGSLLALSWVTALGSVVNAGPGQEWFAYALSTGYPVGDVVVATLALLALARGRHEEQASLVLLTLGLLAVACSDSTFLYLTNTASYSSTDVVANSGWVLGFGLIGLAGSGLAAPRVRAGSRRTASSGTPSTAAALLPARLRLALPYVPLSLAILVLADGLLDEVGTEGAILLLFAAVLVGAMMLRQLLAVLDNQRLRDELHHQAHHDALTGLPNRTLFAERLDRALHRSPSELSVLFCDLNHFKPINDRLGHAVGDRILAEVATRLKRCVRASDTVARMGGDEFAILLEDGADTTRVVERIGEVLAEGVLVDGEQVPISMSVGRAQRPAVVDLASVADRADHAAELLQQADRDMYDAKAEHHQSTRRAQPAAGSHEPVEPHEPQGQPA